MKLGALIAMGRFLKPRLKGLLWVAAVWTKPVKMPPSHAPAATPAAPKPAAPPPRSGDNGFDFLRDKRKLCSKADDLLK
ncbi:MAG: hypothetical protein ACO3PV_11175 [Pseudohongiellaceae bacterium]